MKVNLLYPKYPQAAAITDNAPSFIDQLGLKPLSWDWILGTFILILSLSTVLHPGWRQRLRALIMPPYRVVISIAQADFNHDGSLFRVLKVKTHEGLYLEVYAPADPKRGGLQPLVATTKLPDTRDGFFTFNGQVTNLVIDDVDNDGILDILTSSFDSNMVAHLNVYHLDLKSGSLLKFETSGNTVPSQN